MWAAAPICKASEFEVGKFVVFLVNGLTVGMAGVEGGQGSNYG